MTTDTDRREDADGRAETGTLAETRTQATRTRGATARVPVGATVLAVLTVQVVAFAVAFAVGRPGLYGIFAVVSALAMGFQRGTFDALAATLGTVLLVALGLPLLMLVARQDLALVAEAAADPAVRQALYLSVYAPLLAALASVAFGVPLALLLARDFPGRALVESLVDLPLVVPHSVAGLAVLFGFGQGGAFPQLEILGTVLGMVLAMTFVAAPFAVNAAREAFESVDPRIERAARTLGANRFETFRRVTAPLAWRGMLTGGVLAWARAVSEFGAVAIVAYSVEFFLPGTGNVTAQHGPVFIYNAYLSAGLERSGAIATLLLALSAVIFLLIRTLAYEEGTWP